MWPAATAASHCSFRCSWPAAGASGPAAAGCKQRAPLGRPRRPVGGLLVRARDRHPGAEDSLVETAQRAGLLCGGRVLGRQQMVVSEEAALGIARLLLLDPAEDSVLDRADGQRRPGRAEGDAAGAPVQTGRRVVVVVVVVVVGFAAEHALVGFAVGLGELGKIPRDRLVGEGRGVHQRIDEGGRQLGQRLPVGRRLPRPAVSSRRRHIEPKATTATAPRPQQIVRRMQKLGRSRETAARATEPVVEFSEPLQPLAPGYGARSTRPQDRYCPVLPIGLASYLASSYLST